MRSVHEAGKVVNDATNSPHEVWRYWSRCWLKRGTPAEESVGPLEESFSVWSLTARACVSTESAEVIDL